MQKNPFNTSIFMTLLSVIAITAGSSVHGHDGVRPEGVSEEFINLQTENLEAFARSQQFMEILPGGYSAAAGTPVITAPESIKGFGVGATGEEYDLILQPGHYGRKKGATGGAGKRIEEQVLVSAVVAKMMETLADSGRSVLVVPADGFERPLNTKIFLSIHADGVEYAPNTPPEKMCRSGPSLGYDDATDIHGMHAVAYSLGQALGYSYSDWMEDGFTVNLRKYYAFEHMKTSLFEGVLELGELTCDEEELRIMQNVDKIAINLTKALLFALEVADQ